ncbi:UTP--glucose-1-phosphate uridylyltransferase GalU [Pikeienuella piscinae]|uniref:UTP--glucose-1-phosphate uridylyltransferase n=1 Tax=Pikeienuella piscinae TaxID=2748098 RepID=A0A7L5C3Q8_9RHOB|nr:UTP--glucose-1-phosphate uridylyltransferase GalU [Pikeienuella piscinae]QIE56894.1 UTP--glucose-1-phosphate uridylyltransferase GalU [Pikeienuella piscinae]
MPSVRKAVFPVAGLGTRFLPATKAVPKEVLPLVDKPLIQYAIDEARAAGITDFIFVTAKGKSALENYFDSAPELVRALEEKGKPELLDMIRMADMPSGAISYIRQQEALGLGHAVWCARQLVGDEPFAVILPDDIIESETPCLKQMVEVYEDTGGNIVAAMEVGPEDVSKYGVMDPAKDDGRLVEMKGIVEKPKPGEAPSNLAAIGRYILSPRVMKNLSALKSGAGGEIQLTDAIAEEIKVGRPVYGLRFEGKRFDCGTKLGYLQATVAFALNRPEFHDDFAAFIEKTAKALKSG